MKSDTWSRATVWGIAALLALSAAAPAAGQRKYRKEQSRPVQLGTSAGNARDLEIDGSFIVCSSGTAGALLQMEDEDPDNLAATTLRYFVLSNNHVFSMTNRGRPGDEIVQPGLIDSDCESGPEDAIAIFSSHKKIKFGSNKKNKVDMAIAEAIDGAVAKNGRILRIGVPGNGTVSAFPGQRVMKSGRTTGFTRGEVAFISLDVEVEFATGGAGAVQTATFRNQDIVESLGKPFSGGGDSGAVVYLDLKNTPGAAGTKCPPAVGLLYAGNDQFTVMNPIADVLKQAKKLKPRGEKTLVGCDSPAVAVALAAVSTREDRDLRRALRVKNRFADQILELEGVVGVGVGMERPGPASAPHPAVRILVERADDETLASLPTELDGVPVRVVESGRFRAF